VVQHRNEINFPFKRYQIQPVWRADRPQKGRYREFYQCDVDIIGSRSLLNEFELIEITDRVFERFGMNIDIRINNRKILAGIAEVIGEGDRLTDITVALDKIDKIGPDKVNEELRSRGLSAQAVNKLQPIIHISGDQFQKLDSLGKILSGSETGIHGVNEMIALFEYLESQDLKAGVELDLTLARGLNYYTGAIIEVLSTEVQIGSVCGGGSGLFPKKVITGTRVLFINFGVAEEKYILSVLPEFRKAGIETEIYPDQAKLKRQMSYANGKGIPFVALVGENEISKKVLTLKDMETGMQKELTTEEAIRQVLGTNNA
jgi:histidyl-tRNA synthetase